MATCYESVDKENITSLVFPKADVLSKKEAIQQRIDELKLALSFGNLDYFKIKIYFEDNNFDIANTYIEQMSYFIRCINGLEKSMNTFKDGIETLKIALNEKA